MQEINLCQLEDLNLSCFGCCGHSYTSKEDVLEAIDKNTLEYSGYDNQKRFMERSNSLRACGICRNVVYLDKNKVGCPLHPKLNKKDIRVGHCDTKYKCKTKKLFDTWNQNKKVKFVLFLTKLKKDGLSWYDYSIRMDNDEILKEFIR